MIKRSMEQRKIIKRSMEQEKSPGAKGNIKRSREHRKMKKEQEKGEKGAKGKKIESSRQHGGNCERSKQHEPPLTEAQLRSTYGW